MTANARPHRATSRSSQEAIRRVAFLPGGWGDRLVFGYMFRVLYSLAAIVVPGAFVLAWGALTGFQLTKAMLVFFGGFATGTIVTGEALRVAVYESRLRKQKVYRRFDDERPLPRDIVVQYGTPNAGYELSKRVFDIVFALSAVVFLVPCLLAIMLIIKFDSRGPIFVKLRRSGFRGEPIWIYKFRTTCLSGHDLQYGEYDDPDLTRSGRFLRRSALDQLPQLFNVIGGSLSLVGPRPTRLASEMEEAPSALALDLANFARPGLTGLFEVDPKPLVAATAYLKKRTFAFDVLILFRCAMSALRGF